MSVSGKSLVAACATAALTYATGSFGASMSDVPPPLQKIAKCMLIVLNQTPGVTEAKLDVVDGDGWVHPYLEYLSPPNANGETITIHFEAAKSAQNPGTYLFRTKLVKVFQQGEPGPNFWSTGPLAQEWQSDCNVRVVVDW